jgi:hypothetical protein
VAIALLCILGGIFAALVTNLPVSVYVTSISFACYLLARFVVGPATLGREGRISAGSSVSN